MNHTIIPFSKKKMVKLTGIYILIMLGIAAIIFFIISGDRISLYYLALFVVLFIAGAYPWSEIASIGKVNYYGQHIYIKLKHPEKYVNQLKGMGKDFTGIYLNDSELEISFEELEKLIHEYFQKYR